MRDRYSNQDHLDLEVQLDKTINCTSSFEALVKGDRFSIVIVNAGSVCVQINEENIYLYANDLIVIPARVCCEVLTKRDPLRISIVTFPLSFIFQNSIKRPAVGYFEIFVVKDRTKVTLKDRDATVLLNLFKMLDSGKRSWNEDVFKKEVLRCNFNSLLYELAQLYQSDAWQVKIRHSRKEKLMIQFFAILEKNCKREHNPKFYADVLFISRGHLAKVAKEVTQRTTKQLIEEAIVFEAKTLLQNNDLTMLHIIEELSYCNYSCFSTFFKKHTGISPNEYRLNLKLG